MLKMKYFLKIANIPESTFSKFLRDEYYNELLSVQKLEKLISVIHEKLT
jgi:predicted transcriptional regulator